ncbi:MAG: hypothetical protein JSW67_15535 [Candidatus Latescibacterota bacterium]|nr:MAG: hypothetical protein JSW67_15535 [Candidatus Latescibacterota bacterium]
MRAGTSILFAALVLLPALGSTAWCQASRGARDTGFAHRVEINAYAGYFWSSSYDVRFDNTLGQLDVSSNAWWGVAVDVPVMPEVQLELSYSRTDSDLTFKPSALGSEKRTVGDIAVEYWQAGAVGGTLRGKLLPMGGLTLGATRYVFNRDDVWKFSFIPLLGAKYYANRRLGLRAQVRFPITLVESGGAIGCSSGSGCFVSVTGTAVFQFDLSAGLILLL